MKHLSSILTMLLVTLCLAKCGSPTEDLEGHYRLGISYFSDCADLQRDMDSRFSRRDEMNRRRNEQRLDDPSPMAQSTSAGGASATGTNVQEPGVDEADIVKVIDNELYIARENRIDILNATTLEFLGALPYVTTNRLELYADANRLVVLEQGGNSVKAKIYRRGPSPTLVFEFSSQGLLATSRLKDGKLYLVIQDSLEQVQSSTRNIIGGAARGISCNRLMRPLADDSDMRIVKVHSIDVQAIALKDDATALFGGGDIVYLSADHLYIAKSGFVFPWATSGESPLLITQFSLASGAPQPTAVGVVSGYAKDRWAFHERNGHLAVTTTSRESGLASHITLLHPEGQSLQQVGKTPSFGQGEWLYAIRYVEDFAYAVTFRSVDPLFVFDLSTPTQPTLKGELTIPGFSTYLHPAGAGRLVGVGKPSQWGADEITVFDVSDSTSPKKTSALSVGSANASTPASHDPHAFFFSEDPPLVAVPYQTHQYASGSEAPKALVARLDGVRLVEAARLSHAGRLPAACDLRGIQVGIERLIRSGTRLLAISGGAVTAHELASPAAFAASRTLDPAGGCVLGGPQITYGYSSLGE